MSPQNKVLLITLSEYGQANTMLALLQELVTRQDVEAHIASYPGLEKRVQKLTTSKLESESTTRPTFHALSGPSYEEIYDDLYKMADISHPPTSRSLDPLYHGLNFLNIWDDDQYLALMNQAKQIIKEVDPDIIVVDMLFQPARDACLSSGKKWIINSPVQALDTARMDQPRLKWLWHYPALFSGYSYPLSWRDTFSNIYLNIHTILAAIKSPKVKGAYKFREKHGLEGSPQWAREGEFEKICPSIVETDLPMVVPPTTKMCGPIVLESAPGREIDPELFEWLDRAPTIYINLGTHALGSVDDIRGIIGGVMNGLPAGMQVLWKLMEADKWETAIDNVLEQHGKGEAFKQERLRIVDWIKPDPLSVVQHENVKCFVHHGGANSFFEACYAGVPHIVLAKWYDLYHNAVKAEYRGFGIYGNKDAAPGVEATEFGSAVARIMGDHAEALNFQKRAAEVGELCRQAGGKKTAVDHILQMARR